MSKRRGQKIPAKASPATSTAFNGDTHVNAPASQPGFFPFARYTSVIGVHTSLILFSCFILPRTPLASQFTLTTSKTVDIDRKTTVSLFDSPLATLGFMCAGTALIQIWWSGWIRQWWMDYAYSLNGDKNDEISRKKADGKKTLELRSSILVVVSGAVIINGIIVLFGAPLYSHIPHNILLSMLMSILALSAPTYTLGFLSLFSGTDVTVRRLTWTRLFVELSIRTPVERAIVYPFWGVFVGAWLGALPLPLDWDRPWQAWPLTPAFGAVGGYIIASLAALTVNAINSLADADIQAGREAIQTAKKPI